VLEKNIMEERCPWPGDDALYIQYHDTEWGVPEHDSKMLWEKLTLEGFQAGLSWITILKKRESFRTAFDNFQPEIVATYDELKITTLLQNKDIIRHRGKIEATVQNAKIFLDIEKDQGFNNFFWKYTNHQTLQSKVQTQSEIPNSTNLSEQISKDLKKLGYRYCGPTIVYAFMEAAGLVNNHMINCPRHTEVQAK
jgi:DNA-3-methyladenine glycosylase I